MDVSLQKSISYKFQSLINNYLRSKNKKNLLIFTFCFTYLFSFANDLTVKDDISFPYANVKIAGRSGKLKLGGKKNAKIYLQFDPFALPDHISADQVAKATLTFYVSKLFKPGAFSLEPITSSWSESNFSEPVVVSSSLNSGVIELLKPNQYVSVDVTEIVKLWISGDMSSDGFVLIPSRGVKANIDSKENKKTSKAATLKIVLNSEGTPGVQGPAGPEGPRGEQGEQGAAGPQPMVGTVSTTTLPVGSLASVVVTNVGNSIFNYEFGVPTGAQGPQGETGATGPEGAQGPQGIQGETGATGAQGPQGEQGPIGLTGPQGETGATGPEGAQGPQGIQG
ncbi:MAG: DNRLRE domain-containing protein, partial [Verrucomicrobiae bacterium]|nr:DNRLRE domain-containing protein [Verrucomicrobiae bacterium]